MAGFVGGIAALICAEHLLAMYLHSFSHCLNMAVVKYLEVANVRNMMAVVGKGVSVF